MAEFDRRGLRKLGRHECWQRLASTQVGRIGFTRDRQTIILPVNYLVDDERIYLRTTWGSKLSALTDGGQVAFEVDDYRPGDRLGWSVLIQATPALVADPNTRARLERMGELSWAPLAENPFWVAMHIDEMSGRQIARGDA